jgi:hypothetical protein
MDGIAMDYDLIIRNGTVVDARASCEKVGTGFSLKTMRQQRSRASCVILKSRTML